MTTNDQPDTPSPPSQAQLTEVGTESSSGSRPLYLGFFLFGFTLGVTTGLSTVSGISQILLSSLFTFVGGILLTYTGFKKMPGGEKAVLDPDRVGYGLTALTMGILLGSYGGIYARLDPPVPQYLKERLLQARIADAPNASGKQDTGNGTSFGFELHAESVEICQQIWARLLNSQYSTALECSAATNDLKHLFEATCPSPASTYEAVR